MSGTVQITGVPTTSGGNGSVPLRREIRDLQKNYPEQFDLLIIGLKKYEAMDEKDVLSYYQVAGIHGEPFKPWDNVKGNSDFDFGGYCTHSSVLFATWHRPYLALFEQVLYLMVQDAAKKFPQSLRDRYLRAAKDFRLPYYDWAIRVPSGTSAFPSLISSEKISVTDIDGKKKDIENPLYQFSFHPVNPSPGDFDETWSRFKTTVRYPDANGKSRNAMVSQVLTNESASLRTNVALLLLSYHDFDSFTNNKWRGSNQPGTFGSLEDVHNEIHDRVGGSNGHMAALETSSFDPVFWLHHWQVSNNSNVDRLWAIWQDLNPDSYITPQPAPMTTFTTLEGTMETQDSPLTPFWDRSGTKFWTSAQVKSSATFGYAYPETQRWTFASDQAYRQSLRRAVTSLYGANTLRNFVDNIAKQPAPSSHSTAENVIATSMDKVQTAVHALSKTANPGLSGEHGEQKPLSRGQSATEGHKSPIPSSLARLAPHNTYNEWVVNVRALKHCLGQAYRVLVFLGDITSDPVGYDTEYNCVGRVTIFGRAATTRCGKCQKDRAEDLSVTGTVPITSALLQDITSGQLQDLTPEKVIPYLRENLKWRVTLYNGDERAVPDVPGLQVSVCSTQVTIDDEGLPIYSNEYSVHSEVTAGLPGGMVAGGPF